MVIVRDIGGLLEFDKSKVKWARPFYSLAKVLISLGLFLVIIGLLLLGKPHLPWLGHLPGDISIDRGNVKFYFPLTTCLLLSAIVSLLLHLLRK